MATRADEYAEVRNLLDDPKAGRPSGDAILSALLDREQWMANRLNNTGRVWTRDSETVTTVVGTAEYAMASANFGKLLFAYRTLSSGTLLPVPITEYAQELAWQTYDHVIPPVRDGEWMSGEKIAFYRDDAGANKVRFYPAPAVARTYTLVFSVGVLDRAGLQWSNVPLMPEFSKFRTLTAALFLLPKAEWEGYSMDDNRLKRRELKEALTAEYNLELPEFEQFIKNPMHQGISTVGNWYDD